MLYLIIKYRITYGYILNINILNFKQNSNKLLPFKKLKIIFLFIFITSFIISCSDSSKEFSSKNICKEKLPPFKEMFNGKQDENKLKVLCECIWEEFPNNGWERKVSEKLYNGEDIGWKIKSFSTVFEYSLQYCKKKINE